MDLVLDDQQRMMRDMVRDYSQTKLKPRAAELDRTAGFPARSIDEMAKLGLFGMVVPEEYGGVGADYLSYILCIEEMARACMATSTIVCVVNSLAALPILNFGNADQKQRFLPRIASGKVLGAYALTEAEAGSDPASMRTTAIRKGDEYILSGEKVLISNGGTSDIIIVFAVTDPDGPRGRNITAFVIDKTDVGASLEIGQPESKMGIRGANTTTLNFNDVRVPVANRLGPEGVGLKVALGTTDSGRIVVAAQSLGVARVALEEAVEQSRQRAQFNKPIGKNQGLSFQLADCATRLEAAAHLTYHATRLKQAGQPFTRDAAMAKLYASETAAFVTDVAVQAFGGYGFCRDYPVERYYRDARILRLYEGTSEIQRLVIARHLGL